MSLVAYASSDDSDSEETSTSVAPESKPSRGLFSVLPAPKKATSSALRSEEPSRQAKSSISSRATSVQDGPDSQPQKGGLLFDLPKPKKRTEPVKITIPKIQRENSDSDDDEPKRKRLSQPQGSGTGLSSLLPQPRNMSVKAMNRPLIPYTLTKAAEPKGLKAAALAKGFGSSASPSAIKAAAKSAALQLARQIAAEDHDEEDVAPENYFSLGESTVSLPVAAAPIPDLESRAPMVTLPFVPSVDEDGQSDAPLDFGSGQEGPGAWSGHPPEYPQPSTDPGAPGFYNQPYYPEANPEQADDDEDDDEPGSSEMFDEEAFMRLQGKRNRGKEEIKFLEIKGDDQLSGNQQWMTKNVSEEKQERKSFSKKKGDQPTGQQRRKHQITYLIHQAKERELELKNNWAENKLTRRQTQAKYGF
ncbi:proline-rich protein PRCC [Gadus macrocephalus]|uniref:proline-rich protein PRCC n=1 Tax=Gadus macrocephalus TaxID=80720 RepID=UPI0028CB3E33|nr:proline-rich protein PRCC [Gadus macrocephalus]